MALAHHQDDLPSDADTPTLHAAPQMKTHIDVAVKASRTERRLELGLRVSAAASLRITVPATLGSAALWIVHRYLTS